MFKPWNEPDISHSDIPNAKASKRHLSIYSSFFLFPSIDKPIYRLAFLLPIYWSVFPIYKTSPFTPTHLQVALSSSSHLLTNPFTGWHFFFFLSIYRQSHLQVAFFPSTHWFFFVLCSSVFFFFIIFPIFFSTSIAEVEKNKWAFQKPPLSSPHCRVVSLTDVFGCWICYLQTNQFCRRVLSASPPRLPYLIYLVVSRSPLLVMHSHSLCMYDLSNSLT